MAILGVFLTFRMANSGIRMAEQGLGFHALIARGPGSIPGWESKIPTQLKKLKLKKNLFKKWQIQLSQPSYFLSQI